MPKSRKKYRDKEKALLYVRRNKNANYEKGQFSEGVRKAWDKHEDALVLAHAITDRELAKQLGRSVRAVQVRRCRLKSGEIVLKPENERTLGALS